MNVAVKAGLILGLSVTLVSAVLLGVGLHENFVVYNIVAIAIYILINVGVVFWALRQTAGTAAYVPQLRNSLVLGVVGGVVIFLGAWLLLAVVFPQALEQIREGALVFMENAGLSEEMLAQQMEALDKATPLSQAAPGGFFTVLTSLLSGALIAIFQRRK